MNSSKNLIVPIILAGGKGTRLWPISRETRPKQFLSLMNEASLFQQTLSRVNNSDIYSAPIIITNQEYRFLVAEQALEIGVDLAAILLEPCARNTAPAITAASLVAADINKNQLVHILPSDHKITVDDAYLAVLEKAKNAAQDGKLVTLGIAPSEPATGFGYIEAGEKEASGAHKVQSFEEKPNEARAQEFIDKGNYYWNSGMFLFSAKTFLDECKKLAPKVFSAASFAVEKAKKDLDFIRLDNESFKNSPNISVDYAIFEKTKKAAVVPSPIIWSDLGSWEAVWEVGQRDSDNNLTQGPTSLNKVLNSLIVSEKIHIAADGLEDIAIIASEDAIYVGRLSQSQNVGEIVKILNAKPETSALTQTHQTSYRPWGGYTSVLHGKRFQVKRLFVKPGKRLSLQKHFHRSEHWVVVSGTAEIQVDDKISCISENESVYIPRGAVHRLANPGKILLELIEVQTGSYLGEDDIIRLEDEFGRK